MSALQPLIEQYLDGVKQLRQAVASMSREQILARPILGKWSTLEVVAHLADFEPILADRMKRIIAEENPTLLGADENCFAKMLAYSSRDLQEELTIIDATRNQMARILGTLTDFALLRTGTHNERGPLTLEKLLGLAIKHIPHHVAFIAAKRKAMGLR